LFRSLTLPARCRALRQGNAQGLVRPTFPLFRIPKFVTPYRKRSYGFTTDQIGQAGPNFWGLGPKKMRLGQIMSPRAKSPPCRAIAASIYHDNRQMKNPVFTFQANSSSNQAPHRTRHNFIYVANPVPTACKKTRKTYRAQQPPATPTLMAEKIFFKIEGSQNDPVATPPIDCHYWCGGRCS
jgi:hypothetical protein